jgi:hypothetical protein
MRRLAFLTAALALLATPLAPMALADGGSLEQVLVETGTTPQQHEALANYYGGKAAAARKEADYHRAMGKPYGGGKVAKVAAMKQHCEKLAALYDDQAREFDTLPACSAPWPSDGCATAPSLRSFARRGGA